MLRVACRMPHFKWDIFSKFASPTTHFSMNEIEKLRNLFLASYIIKATALIGKQRGVGGNQFRHAFATLAILIDYKLFDDYFLLKASVIHDLIEDDPETNEHELRCIDDQSENFVLPVAIEVNKDMAIELKDLINKRRRQLYLFQYPGLFW